nr:hypothetical protein [Lachnospiraceae bacterium]
MKNSWMKRCLVSVLAFVITITAVPYEMVVEAADEEIISLSGVVTEDDNVLPTGNYVLTEDTTFSGSGDVWTFGKRTSIDLCGHKLTLDGVTLSIEAGELQVTDSTGAGQVYSENSQLFHIPYKRSRILSLDKVSLVYAGDNTSLVPVWAECQVYAGDSSLTTTSEYGMYVNYDLWLWNMSFSGFTNSEVLLGNDGEICYFEEEVTYLEPINVSLKNLDFSEMTSKALIVPMGNEDVPRSITDTITFTEVPEDCQIMYRDGEYDAVMIPVIELCGSYDLGENMFPGISLDESGNYQMDRAYYKATGDVSFSSEEVDGGEYLNIFLAEGKEVILDLNGHTINMDTMTIRAEEGSLTILDSAEGGVLNGGFYFDGRNGSFNMESGTYNIVEEPRVAPMRGIPFLLFGYSRFDMTGGTINCYYSTHEMIEGMDPIIDISGGEINFYPRKKELSSVDMFQVGSYKKEAVRISGGTIRMEGVGLLNMFELLEGNLEITGGDFILGYEGSNEQYKEKSALLNSEFNMNVSVSGGNFTTNTDHCFVDASYRSDVPTIHFSGSPTFNVAKYDYSSQLHWGRKDSVLNSIEIKEDFNIGRKLNYYAEKTPTEENPIIFVRNWTQNRGEEDPSDVMNIYLPDDKVCTPIVVDGNVSSGTITDAPEPEPEIIDGLEVCELQGTYSLTNLEVPNTTRTAEGMDSYYWTDGYYRLSGDTTFTTELINSKSELSNVYVNDNIIIDLNGHSLTVDPIRFVTKSNTQFTILDSKTGGELNGPAFMWGSGDINLLGGTLNLTENTKQYSRDWAFNLSGGNLTVDKAVVNCYHDSDIIMIQAMGRSTITMTSGELNYIPTKKIPTWHEFLIYAMDSTVNISGGTLRLEASSRGCILDVPDSKVKVTGGTFISKCTGTDANEIALTRVVDASSGMKSTIAITGGSFTTNGNHCIYGPIYTDTKVTLGGNLEMDSTKYDVYYSGSRLIPLNLQSDFSLGRKMKIYTNTILPTEETVVPFVSNWTKNLGDKNPSDVFEVYLKEGNVEKPYVLDGSAVCGGLTKEPEYIDGLQVCELQGTYNLSNLEVPNTSRKEEGKDEYYWADGYYRLAGDTTFSTSLINSASSRSDVYINENVVIDLNGHTLTVDPICFNTVNTSNFTIVDS